MGVGVGAFMCERARLAAAGEPSEARRGGAGGGIAPGLELIWVSLGRGRTELRGRAGRRIYGGGKQMGGRRRTPACR